MLLLPGIFSPAIDMAASRLDRATPKATVENPVANSRVVGMAYTPVRSLGVQVGS